MTQRLLSFRLEADTLAFCCRIFWYNSEFIGPSMAASHVVSEAVKQHHTTIVSLPLCFTAGMTLWCDKQNTMHIYLCLNLSTEDWSSDVAESHNHVQGKWLEVAWVDTAIRFPDHLGNLSCAAMFFWWAMVFSVIIFHEHYCCSVFLLVDII